MKKIRKMRRRNRNNEKEHFKNIEFAKNSIAKKIVNKKDYFSEKNKEKLISEIKKYKINKVFKIEYFGGSESYEPINKINLDDYDDIIIRFSDNSYLCIVSYNFDNSENNYFQIYNHLTKRQMKNNIKRSVEFIRKNNIPADSKSETAEAWNTDYVFPSGLQISIIKKNDEYSLTNYSASKYIQFNQ